MTKAKAKKVIKKNVAKEEFYSDIKEEDVVIDGEVMVKQTYMNKNKVVKEEMRRP